MSDMSDRRPGGIADLSPLDRRKEQQAWYCYDWANSAFTTTIARRPLRAVHQARSPRTPRSTTGSTCSASRSRRGRCRRSSSPLSTILSAVAPAAARRGRRPHRAQEGPARRLRLGRRRRRRRCCSSSPATTGSSARSPSSSPTSASAPPRSSTTRSCCLISHRGRARPGLLAAAGPWATPAAACCSRVNFVLVTLPRPLRAHRGHGRPDQHAVGGGLVGRRSRSSRSAGSRTTRRAHVEAVEGGVFARSFGQLWATLKDMRNYPVALTFLARLPVLQRRHPDRHRLRLDLRRRGARLRARHRAGDVPRWCSSWPSAARCSSAAPPGGTAPSG